MFEAGLLLLVCWRFEQRAHLEGLKLAIDQKRRCYFLSVLVVVVVGAIKPLWYSHFVGSKSCRSSYKNVAKWFRCASRAEFLPLRHSFCRQDLEAFSQVYASTKQCELPVLHLL